MNTQAYSDDTEDLQGNIAGSYAGAHCARMMFLCFSSPVKARRWLAEIEPRILRGTQTGQLPCVNVALTYEGLRALGVSDVDLGEFPAPFREGMKRRAALLGDPPFEAAGESAVDAPATMVPASKKLDRTVHAMLLVYAESPPELRTLLVGVGKAAREGFGKMTPRDWAPQLTRAVEERMDAVCGELPLVDGVDALGYQDLHLPLVAPDSDEFVEYFGFRDGLSQPAVDLTEKPQDESYRSNPSRIVVRSENPLLDKGSFLVVRQLEQDVGAFWRVMSAQAKSQGIASPQVLAEQVVGRQMNGAPLGSKTPPRPGEVQEAFDPSKDAQGAVCPFHSHVRRVNPRIDTDTTPRILRRGMSYALDNGTRGLMFMAFNADIAAQFEFLQRNWIQRGTNVGLTSADRDIVAGLGPKGQTSEFDCKVGDQQLVLDLPSFVQLKWGSYFWVPSRSALRSLSGALHSTGPVAQRPAQRTPDLGARLKAAKRAKEPEALIRGWLDDAEMTSSFWAYVREKGGLKVGRWAFVADPKQVRMILADDGTRFSVAGYGKRMLPSTGPFFLGMDASSPAYKREQPTVAIIPTLAREVAAVQKTARMTTLGFIKSVVEPKAQLLPNREAQVTLVELLAVVLDSVSTHQFGLSGPGGGSLLEWAGDVTTYFFRLAADDIDSAKGVQAARQFRAYVTSVIEAEESGLGPKNERLSKTLAKMKDALGGGSVSSDDLARNLLGIISGSLSATMTLFAHGLSAYVSRANAGGRLTWPDKAAQLVQGHATDTPSFFSEMVAKPLAACRRGAPESLYRMYKGNEPWDLGNGEKIASGELIGLWFGGLLEKDTDALFGAGPHYCPGRDMGKAIINGTLQGLYEAWQQPITVTGRDLEIALTTVLPDAPPAPQAPKT